MKHTKARYATLLTLLLSAAAGANEQQDLLELKHTVLNLVDALVKQGVLNQQQAQALVKKAESDAATQAQVATAPAAAAAPRSTQVAEAEVPPASSKVVRVPYVPEFVKQQIRDQLRGEVRRDVMDDMAQKAKAENWGTPDILPPWVKKFKLYGDVRVRDQYDHYGKDNADQLSAGNLYLDILKVNAAGGIAAAGTGAFLNTSRDTNRWNGRLRLGISALINDDWKVDTRITTGNQQNPVSTNQTLGSYGQRFSVQLDTASLQYTRKNERGQPWLAATFGRMQNPFFVPTDLVWDDDLGFDGAAVKLSRPFSIGGEGLDAIEDTNAAISFTAGVFPIQQVSFSSADKWLAGGQLGLAFDFENQNKLQFGAAYYDYIHIQGRRNALGSTLTNSTAPTYLQKGNLLFNIANDPNLNGGANDQIFALASDYRLVDLSVSLDLAYLAPYHVVLNGDLVKNLGFDEDGIRARTGGTTYLYPIENRTLGWQFEVVTGWPKIAKLGDWQIFGGYRYLQRDAVLDAFTDQDFHLGGTDAKGYKLGFNYGLGDNVWIRTRWLSSNEIDGPPLAIDNLWVDLNARF